MLGDLRPSDVLPACHQFGRGKALLGKAFGHKTFGHIGKHAGRAGLVHGMRLCHIGWLEASRSRREKKVDRRNQRGMAMTIQRFENGPRMSRAVVHGDTVYLAGLTADATVGQSVAEQTKAILGKIDNLLKQGGTDKNKLVQATIWLQDIRTVDEFNQVWDAWVAPNSGARLHRGKAAIAGQDDRDSSHGSALSVFGKA